MSNSYDLPKRLADKAMLEADALITANHRAGVFDDGDPNHPKYNNGINYITGNPISIFGYETAEFMARQYK